MKYCQTTTEFNGGVDLHSRQMFACVMDRQVLVSTNLIGDDFAEFLRRVDLPCAQPDGNWTPALAG